MARSVNATHLTNPHLHHTRQKKVYYKERKSRQKRCPFDVLTYRNIDTTKDYEGVTTIVLGRV